MTDIYLLTVLHFGAVFCPHYPTRYPGIPVIRLRCCYPDYRLPTIPICYHIRYSVVLRHYD